MAIKRVIWWVLVLAVLGWVGYKAAGASWSYYAAQELIDKALSDASSRHREAFSAGNQRAVDALTESVRAAILLAAMHDGLQVEENDVIVSANSTGFSALVRWSYPLVSYQSYDLLVIPLSVRRTLGVRR